MNLLIINSNTNNSVTETIAACARSAASAGCEVTALTAPFGPAVIEGRADAVVAAHATLEAITAYPGEIDAAIIACFSDPGLAAIRDAVNFPVVGIAEASMHTACMLGARFSIVAVAPSTIPQILDLVASYGLSQRLASVRAINRNVLESHADRVGTARELGKLVDIVVSEDGADVAILGGAVTAGLIDNLGNASHIPVLDGVGCAVRQAEVLARSYFECFRRG